MPRSVLLLFHEAHQAFAGTRADVALRGFHVPAAKCCFDWEVLVAVWCHVVTESDAVRFYLAL